MRRVTTFLIAFATLTSLAMAQGPRYPRVIFFDAEWCGPCRIALDGPGGFRKWLEASGWIIDGSDRAHVQLVDIDRRADLAELHGIRQIPCLLLVDGNKNSIVPYTGRDSITRLLSPAPKAAATAAAPADKAFDLRTAGCKLRPDLGSGINTVHGVLTCWHCVSGTIAKGQRIEVECDGQVGIGTVIRHDVQADLALLSVAWSQPRPVVACPDLSATGSASDPKPGDVLRSVSRMNDGTIGVETHRVLGAAHDGMLQVDNPFISGSSGGGLVDAKDQVVGVISGNIVDTEPYRGLVISNSAVQKLLHPPTTNAGRQR